MKNRLGAVLLIMIPVNLAYMAIEIGHRYQVPGIFIFTLWAFASMIVIIGIMDVQFQLRITEMGLLIPFYVGVRAFKWKQWLRAILVFVFVVGFLGILSNAITIWLHVPVWVVFPMVILALVGLYYLRNAFPNW